MTPKERAEQAFQRFRADLFNAGYELHWYNTCPHLLNDCDDVHDPSKNPNAVALMDDGDDIIYACPECRSAN